MKNVLTTVLITAMCLFAVAAVAQQPAPQPRTDGDAVRPSRCTTTTVYTRGPAPAPTFRSPQLTSFLAPLHPVGYGVDQPNHAFGDSFRICPCETCGAKIEIGVRKVSAGDNPDNDNYVIGLAPFNPAGSLRVADGRIWSAGDPPAKTLTINLSQAKLNKLLCSQKGCASWLDVYIEDDTVVEWIKLTVLHP